MGQRGSSGKDDMDKPVSKKHMARAKKMQKARTNKSQQAQKIALAERTGNLSMPGAKLAEIPAQVIQIQKMTFVELSNNAIESIPSAINGLVKLKKLKLSKNRIEKVPELTGLTSLDTLLLDNNRITVLSGLPKKLQTLALQGNALSSFPVALEGLKSLEKLNISKNALSGNVPGWLGRLKYLRNLELDDNKLTGVETGLGDADRLEKLMLRRNALAMIPASVLRSKALAAMRLEGNKITKTKLMGMDGWEEFDEKRKALINKQVSAGIGDFDRSVCGLD